MRIKSIETLGSTPSADDGSVVLLQKFSCRQRRFRAIALAGCGAILALPLSTILADTAARAHLAALITTDPAAVGQLAIVYTIALGALIFGLLDLFQPVISKRIIRLDPERVRVAETVRGRERVWHEPVDAYRGIRHRIMTTSAGTMHTLSLEHPRAARSLCIAYETHVSNQAMIDAAGRYQLPILPSGLPSGSTTMRDRVAGTLSQWLSGWGGVADGESRAAST